MSDGEVPGLDYLAEWIDPVTAAAVSAAIDAGEWSTGLRRRVQHFGHRYDYGRRGLIGDAAPPLPRWARELARRLVAEGHLGTVADQVIVNEYLPGQGISAHVDAVSDFGPVVAAVSLGSDCVMDFALPGEGSRVPVRLAARSLVVMTGPSRYEWRHSIAARKSDPGLGGRVPRGRRVSVTFRTRA